MDNIKKQNNFLNAIQKYAKKQKQEMISEVERYKIIELQKAKEESKKEAHDLVLREIENKHNEMTSSLAKEEHESLVAIYNRRQEIINDIFKKATEKLNEYAKTEEYKESVFVSAEKMAKTVGDNDVKIFVTQKDLELATEIKNKFFKNVEIMTANDIKIGGLRCVCNELNIVLEDTLDSRLVNEFEFFTENSKLKVV